MRPSGRATDALRTVSIETGVTRHAEGSCLIRMGDTHVLCTASVEETVPPFLRKTGLGWVTAEYGMLPRSTTTRTRREAARRQAVGPHPGDPAADRAQPARRRRPGGARRAADHRRLRRASRPTAAPAAPRSPAAGSRCDWRSTGCSKAGAIKTDPLTAHVAAVSCGIYGGQPVLDLDYAEDSVAGHRRELRDDRRSRPDRGAGQRRGRDLHPGRSSTTLLDLAEKGAAELVAAQRAALA